MRCFFYLKKHITQQCIRICIKRHILMSSFDKSLFKKSGLKRWFTEHHSSSLSCFVGVDFKLQKMFSQLRTKNGKAWRPVIIIYLEEVANSAHGLNTEGIYSERCLQTGRSRVLTCVSESAVPLFHCLPINSQWAGKCLNSVLPERALKTWILILFCIKWTLHQWRVLQENSAVSFLPSLETATGIFVKSFINDRKNVDDNIKHRSTQIMWDPLIKLTKRT